MNNLLTLFLSIFHSWPNRIVALFLAIFTLLFFFQFLTRALWSGRKLSNCIKQLKIIKKNSNGSQVIDLEPFEKQAMSTEILQHLWGEYVETLHPQKKINASGQEEINCWRATAMAESFFTEQVLVDTPLRTEFYKHLPGILTGLGIIGTFSGLIQGLSQFEVTNNPDAVRACLSNLIQGVGHAFYVSAVAIGLAMLFTWIEKSLITARYRQVEDIGQLIDGFFDAGAGEEYLSRLVQASETSATQAMQLKDALVTDLKQILADITSQQIEAANSNSQQISIDAAANSQQIARDITQALKDSLHEPIQHISTAINQVGSNQGEAVNKLLTDVLVNFSSQMQEMFGGQLRGISDLLSQTNSAMLGTVTRFDQLAANLQNAGQGAAEAMAERLREAIASMEVRQSAMTQQMGEFIEQMRTVSKNSQSETNKQLQAIISDLGNKMSLMVEQLDTQAKQSSGNHQNQLANLTEQMEKFISGMQKLALESNDATSQKLHESLGQIGTQVSQMVEKMDEQAKTAAHVHNESLSRVAGQMESFLTTTKEATNEAHKTTAQASQTAVAALGRQVQAALAGFQLMNQRLEETSALRQTELANQSAQLLGNLSSQIDSLSQKIAESAETTKSSVTLMASASKSAIERMNSGADTLLLASSELTDAEKRVAATMGAMEQVSQGLQVSANTLSGASSGVQKVFEDHKSTTTSFEQITANLKSIIETAKREASLSVELVSKLHNAAEKLSNAQGEAEHYLEGVTEVLGSAHEAFANEITKTLRSGNATFLAELSSAVNMLKSAIADLGDTLESLPGRK